MKTSTPSPAPDPKALLDAANRASEKVATLHIAFLALCAYILVIVFGTTDMDLLIGKGVKLPVVDVEVSIVGFYAAVPYLIVLVHFNLLLQLQLLSRKLYAFDEAAPKHAGIGGLHDQLHIFPYNYYLVGQPSRLVGRFIALVVTITMLLLPLAALLMLQARFLAYQGEGVTWLQRAAIWLDVVLVVMLWPLIMDRRARWSAYIHDIWLRARLHWLRWLWGSLGFAIFIAALTSESQVVSLWLVEAFIRWFLLTLFIPVLRWGLRWLSRGRYFAAPQTVEPLTLGVRGLLATLLVGLPLPLILVADGELIDRPVAYGILMQSLRHLDLREKVLFAKPARPEILADLRGTDPTKREAALRSVERVHLQKRSLRGANFYKASMPMADLREANLQGANFWKADLQGVDLTGAQLQSAKLSQTQLQGADLSFAQLQGASLVEVQLQGANLFRAQLQAAHLSFAKLQVANLPHANLQGANLHDAELQGAVLWKTNLTGANLRGATLYTSSIMMKEIEPVLGLVDARGLKWQPLSAKDMQRLRKEQIGWAWSSQSLQTKFDDFIRLAARPGLRQPQIVSCLRGTDLQGIETQVTCKESYSLGEFRKRLLPELEQLACDSPYIARGLVERFDTERLFSNAKDAQDSTIKGLMTHLQQRINVAGKGLCPGLVLLTAEDKQRLRGLAEWDDETSRLFPAIGIDSKR